MSSLDITSVLGSYYFHQTHTANAPKSPIDPLCSVFNLYDNDNPNEETDVTEFDSSHIKISDVHPPELDQYLPCLNNFVTVPTPTPFRVPTRKVLLPWLKANVTPEPEHVPITAQYNSSIADKGTHGSTYTSHISVLLTEAPSTILKVGTEVEGGIEGRLTKILNVNEKQVQFMCELNGFPYGIMVADCGDVKLPWQWKMKQAYRHFMVSMKRIVRVAVTQIL